MASVLDEAPVKVRQRAKKRVAFGRTLVRGLVAGVGLVLMLGAADALVGSNIHTVIPGRVYRSAQLAPNDLEKVVNNYGIRTVLNLRGCSAPIPWYLDECRVTQQHGVSQEDICLSSSRLPSVTEVQRLLEVLDRCEQPILLHCRRGADRTGMVSALILLLNTDVPYATGRRQLSLRFGHLPVPPPVCLDRFFDMYESWLAKNGTTHTPERLRSWIERDYCPGRLRSRLEVLEAPDRLTRGRPAAMRVRCHNTGTEPWRLQKDAKAAIHAAFYIYDDQDRMVVSGQAGMFDAEVAPGESCDVTLVLPAPKTPGQYHLLMDMVDEQQCWFFQVGSEPLERELVVE
jgi:protein tyrosine phosphatase (PTP) superfamily phosphohydrolase (DUF442 family)